jgi:hypothetical protein
MARTRVLGGYGKTGIMDSGIEYCFIHRLAASKAVYILNDSSIVAWGSSC